MSPLADTVAALIRLALRLALARSLDPAELHS